MNRNKIETEFDNRYISFIKEQKDYIDKNYDISRNNNEIVNNDNIENFIFHVEQSNETYHKLFPKDVDTQIRKNIFIKIMEENNEFPEKKEKDEYEKCEKKFKSIISDAINSKNFYLFNNEKLSNDDTKKLISFFNQLIFENEKNTSENSYFKKYINIFLEKLLIPMFKFENKTKETYELISLVSEIFLSEKNLKKILEFDNKKRIFDNETVKKILDEVIVKLIQNEKHCTKVDFKKFYKTFFDLIITYNKDASLISATISDDEQIHNNLLYLYKILHDIIKYNKDSFEISINNLLLMLNQMKYSDLRGVIYEIIFVRIEGIDKLKGICTILDEKLLRKIFIENSKLLTEIILKVDYQDFKEKNKFIRLIIPSLFNFAIKNKKLEELLDLLYKVISIKDEYTLERLYLIMGFPQFIFENPKKIENEDNEEDMKDKTEAKTEENKDSSEEYNEFWPRFGIPYIEENEGEEMFKYISNLKIYESHCILAQLFHCSKDSLYDNPEFIEGEQKLTEKERNKYIYQLLCIALLNEGNYCLFKYIYLTQSRFILKYNNLYEEMIDILSHVKDNAFNLEEITKNANICIKRINYEINKTDENDNIPELPENMKKSYMEYDNIKKFTGFIPKHLPDKISKVLYSISGGNDNFMIIMIKYYTTYKDLETLRKEKKSNINEGIEKDIEKNDELNITNEEDEENDDNDFHSYDIYDDENDIEDNEDLFLTNIYNRIGEVNIKLYDGYFSQNKKDAALSLIRFIFFNNSEKEILFKERTTYEIKKRREKENNYFFSEFSNIGYTKKKNYGEIYNIYRKNYTVDFINENKIENEVSVKEKNKIIFPREVESYFSYFNENEYNQ